MEEVFYQEKQNLNIMGKSQGQKLYELSKQGKDLTERIKSKELKLKNEKDSNKKRILQDEIEILKVKHHLKGLQFRFECDYGK